MNNLEGKVAVITGGNGVLGGAIALGLTKRRIKVGILGRTPETVEKRVAEITNEGGEALALVADVLDEKALKDASAKIIGHWVKSISLLMPPVEI